jgi:hypothetical protein
VVWALLAAAAVWALGWAVGQPAGWQPAWLRPESFSPAARLLLSGWSVFGYGLVAACLVLLLGEWRQRGRWEAHRDVVLDGKAAVDNPVAAVCRECRTLHGANNTADVYREFFYRKLAHATAALDARWLFYYPLAVFSLVPAVVAFFMTAHDAAGEFRPMTELGPPLGLATALMLVCLLAAIFVRSAWANTLRTAVDDLAEADPDAGAAPARRSPEPVRTPEPYEPPYGRHIGVPAAPEPPVVYQPPPPSREPPSPSPRPAPKPAWEVPKVTPAVSPPRPVDRKFEDEDD